MFLLQNAYSALFLILNLRKAAVTAAVLLQDRSMIPEYVCVWVNMTKCVCVKCVFLSQHVQCLRVSACVLFYAAVVSLLQ